MSEREEFVVFHEALLQLTHAIDFLAQSRRYKLERLTRLCAELLQIDRVSIWEYYDDDQALQCEMLYDFQRQASVTENVRILASEHPDYFEALRHYRLGQRIVGLEALVRWPHSEFGLVSPVEFLPLAREAGIMSELGSCVLELVCRDISQQQAKGVPLPQISVNLASEQVTDPVLPEQVAAVLRRFNLQGNALCFEVIEDQIKGDSEQLRLTLDGLVELGIELAIDDFGTGYSSLSRLKQLPFRKLKVDRSFVSDLPEDTNDCAITLSILGLARGLGLEVVAEGIENESQLNWLTLQGCDFLQGFHFCRPAPLDNLLERVDLQTWQLSGPSAKT